MNLISCTQQTRMNVLFPVRSAKEKKCSKLCTTSFEWIWDVANVSFWQTLPILNEAQIYTKFIRIFHENERERNKERKIYSLSLNYSSPCAYGSIHIFCVVDFDISVIYPVIHHFVKPIVCSFVCVSVSHSAVMGTNTCTVCIVQWMRVCVLISTEAKPIACSFECVAATQRLCAVWVC